MSAKDSKSRPATFDASIDGRLTSVDARMDALDKRLERIEEALGHLLTPLQHICAVCGNDLGETEDGTPVCPMCTNGD
jgi:rubrerythrin